MSTKTTCLQRPLFLSPLGCLYRQVSPYIYILLQLALLSFFLDRYAPLDEADNFKVLDDQGINFGMLPIVFFVFGYGILTILAGLLEMDVLFFGNILSLIKG